MLSAQGERNMKNCSPWVRWLLVAALIVSPFGGCATKKPIPPAESKAVILEEELAEEAAIKTDEKRKVDQVDQALRIASMALDTGKPKLAREKLIEATSFMAAGMPEKDFLQRAEKATGITGREAAKYFIGDPYEQMMAYLYLGILDFQAGEYEKALASFRTASLADQASSEEGYKSDSYLAFLLEGITCRMVGDEPGQEEAFRLASRAFQFRQRVPFIKEALYRGAAQWLGENPDADRRHQLDVLFPLVFSQLPLSAFIHLDPASAVQSAFEAAGLLLREEDRRARSEEANEVWKAFAGNIDAVTKEMAELKALALAQFSEESLTSAYMAEAEFASLVEFCRQPRTNTFLIYQAGTSPTKIRLGQYGQVVQVRTHPCPIRRSLLSIHPMEQSGLALASLALPGESIDYQATTRGGREMDSILEGKAKFRDAMNVSSTLSGTVATAALTVAMVEAATLVTTTTTVVTPTVTASGAIGATTTSTTSTATAGLSAATPALIVAGAAFLLYQGFKIASDAAHPEGDVRGWHELPSHLLFACAALKPGSYELRMDFFDALARPLPQETECMQFTVDPGRPSLLLLGTPWG